MNGDFSAKLDSLLSNPAMMAQIKSLADTMTAESREPIEVKKTDSEQSSTLIPSEGANSEENSHPTSALPSKPSLSIGIERNLKNIRALLFALKPYLDAERCEKVDKMLKMMQLAEMAGYFRNLL